MLTGGSVISGASGNRYRIEWYLTEGTTGTTYQAVDQSTDEPVIVKVLNLSGDNRVADAFWREGEVLKALVRLEGAVGDGLHNVPRVVDIQHAGAEPFMVLELLSGLPLETLMERQGFLSEAEAMVVAEQTLRVLALLHHLPRTMLSFRPKDIWLQRRADGTIHHVNMVDWKHVSGELNGPLTREQETRDIAQVARLFFWMVTGKKLEKSPLPEDELAQKAGSRWSAVSPGMRQLLIKSLSPDPSQRYRTAAIFRRAVQNQQGLREGAQGQFYQMMGQAREQTAAAPEAHVPAPAPEPRAAETPVHLDPPIAEEEEDRGPFVSLRMQGASSVDQEALRAAPKPPAEEPKDKEAVVTRRYSAEERQVIGFEYEPTIVSLREELVDALAEAQREHEQALQALRRRQSEEMSTARAEYEQQVGELKGRLGGGIETAEREYEEAILALRRQQAEQVAATQREHAAALETARQQQEEEAAALRRDHEMAMEALRRQQAEELATAQSSQQQQQVQEATMPTSLHDDVLLTLDRLSSLLRELEYRGLDQQLKTMRAEIEERLKELQPLSGKEEPMPQWLEVSPAPPTEAVETEVVPEEQSEARPLPTAVEAEAPVEETFTPQQLDDIKGEMEELLWGSFPEIPKLTREAMADVNARYTRARELLSHVADPVFQAKIDRASRLLGYLTKKQDAAMMGRLKLYPDFHDFIDTAPEGGETALQWVQANSVLDWMERARQSFEQAKSAMSDGDQSRAADLLAVSFALSRMVEHTLVYLWQQYLPEESYSLEALDAFQAEVQRTGRQGR